MRQLDPIEYPERERRILLEEIGQADDMDQTEDSINAEANENDVCLVFYRDYQVVWNVDEDDYQYQIYKHETISESGLAESVGYFDSRSDVVDEMRSLLRISQDSE